MNDLINNFANYFSNIDISSIMDNKDNMLLLVAGCLIFGAIVIQFIKKYASVIIAIVGLLAYFNFR